MVYSFRKGVAAQAGNELSQISLAMQELDQRTADLENGSANTQFQSSEPSEADMSSGIIYVWTDANGLLVIGGLDEETGSKTTTQTQVSVEDPGLIGGVIGGLL